MVVCAGLGRCRGSCGPHHTGARPSAAAGTEWVTTCSVCSKATVATWAGPACFKADAASAETIDVDAVTPFPAKRDRKRRRTKAPGGTGPAGAGASASDVEVVEVEHFVHLVDVSASGVLATPSVSTSAASASAASARSIPRAPTPPTSPRRQPPPATLTSRRLGECAICMEEMGDPAVNEIKLTSCGHQLHWHCAKSLVVAMVTDSAAGILCPHIDCRAPLHPHQIEMLAGESISRKAERNALQSAVASDPSLHLCPTPDCDYVIEWKGPDDGPVSEPLPPLN